MMTIRGNIVRCIEKGGTPDEIARRICGMLSCEGAVDNGNGWYDNDPEMAADGLDRAEAEWFDMTEAEREERILALITEIERPDEQHG